MIINSPIRNVGYKRKLPFFILACFAVLAGFISAHFLFTVEATTSFPINSSFENTASLEDDAIGGVNDIVLETEGDNSVDNLGINESFCRQA